MSEHTSLEDSGAFITVVHDAGIAHPPGYPLYTMLGKLFTLIPLDNVAFRVKLVSATAGALTAVCIYFCCLVLFRVRGVAFLCALFFGLCELPWNHSVTAEVYALHALFYFLLLYFALRLHKDFNCRDLYLMTFFLGLSLSHHWPLMVLASISFVPLLFGQHPLQRARFMLARTPVLAGILLLGLLPYFYLVIRSHFSPYITAFGPVSLAELPAYVLRARYAKIDASTTATLMDSLLFFRYFLSEYIRQIGVVGTLALAAGMVFAVVCGNRCISIALFLGFLASPLVLLAFLSFDYDILRRDAYMTYQIVPFGIGALFLHYALTASGRFAAARQHRLAAVGVVSGIVICAATFATNLNRNDMRGNTMAFDYAEAVLSALPKGAVLFIDSDRDLGPIAYTHTVAGIRPDVRVYSSFGYVFGNRLYNPAHNSIDEAQDILRGLLHREKRLFVTVLTGPFIDLGKFPVHDHGLFFEVSLSDEKSPLTDTQELAKTFLDRHRNDRYQRIWRHHRQQIMADFCRTLLLWDEPHPVFAENNTCKRLQARKFAKNSQHGQAATLYSELLSDAGDFIGKEYVQLNFEYMNSAIMVINGKSGGKKIRRPLFQKLVDEVYPATMVMPDCDNVIVRNLLEMRAQIDVNVRLDELRERFGQCRDLRSFFKRTARVR